MTKTIKAKLVRQERAKICLDLADRREIARDCGLQLRSVALAPADVYGAARPGRRGEDGFDGGRGGRREFADTLFDPRAYDRNTRVDYYALPTAA